MAGAWCNLASSITAEMASNLGYDWVLLDQEHGPGDNITLFHQMQAISTGGAAALVRITWNEMPRFNLKTICSECQRVRRSFQKGSS